jgi:hypothetical protein
MQPAAIRPQRNGQLQRGDRLSMSFSVGRMGTIVAEQSGHMQPAMMSDAQAG